MSVGVVVEYLFPIKSTLDIFVISASEYASNTQTFTHFALLVTPGLDLSAPKNILVCVVDPEKELEIVEFLKCSVYFVSDKMSSKA
jgi:hypothetical protein